MDKYIDEIEDLQFAIISTILSKFEDFNFIGFINSLNLNRFSKGNKIILNGIKSYIKEHGKSPDFEEYVEFIKEIGMKENVYNYVMEKLVNSMTENAVPVKNLNTLVLLLDEYHIKRAIGKIM